MDGLSITGDFSGHILKPHWKFFREYDTSRVHLVNLRGWQFPTEKNVLKNHVFLKLKNIENTVDMYWSIDGINWN